MTKSSINNRGYNKHLQLEGDVHITINYQKYEQDSKWDGLKGYVTNTRLSNKKVVENYQNLWQIEKAFRISKADLRIRPVYHRLRHRIEAHICIAFSAYCVYKEPERVLFASNVPISVKQAAELTHNMYQIEYILPESKQTRTQLLKMDQRQAMLCEIILENF